MAVHATTLAPLEIVDVATPCPACGSKSYIVDTDGGPPETRTYWLLCVNCTDTRPLPPGATVVDAA